ncbi:MAG: RnfABCDGE type electron transport complex subunit G [Treponema sp.]|jgi:electron transport complex protein RnfG|nr:RnfABCDGE type electron transport complex subunit G [Treponema sp.]
MKNMLKLGIVLSLFAAAACVMLAFVYEFTKKDIELNTVKAENKIMESLFDDDTVRFNPVSGIVSGDERVVIQKAWEAVKNGETIGAVLQLSRAGYGGPVITMVGVSVNETITGVRIMDHKETPGLGANAASPKYFVNREKGITFYGQFEKKKVTDPFTINNDVEAITASTITSTAVSDSVKAAGLAAKAFFAGKGTK